MFNVYVLKSKQNNSYYVGSCQNIVKRVDLHNRGFVKSTKRYCPWQLVHIEKYNNFKTARSRELRIKSWKKRSAIESLIDNSKF